MASVPGVEEAVRVSRLDLQEDSKRKLEGKQILLSLTCSGCLSALFFSVPVAEATMPCKNVKLTLNHFYAQRPCDKIRLPIFKYKTITTCTVSAHLVRFGAWGGGELRHRLDPVQVVTLQSKVLLPAGLPVLARHQLHDPGVVGPATDHVEQELGPGQICINKR